MKIITKILISSLIVLALTSFSLNAKNLKNSSMYMNENSLYAYTFKDNKEISVALVGKLDGTLFDNSKADDKFKGELEQEIAKLQIEIAKPALDNTALAAALNGIFEKLGTITKATYDKKALDHLNKIVASKDANDKKIKDNLDIINEFHKNKKLDGVKLASFVNSVMADHVQTKGAKGKNI